MKKFVCLLFISAFALTGCSSEISPEDAELVAQDIKNYEIDTNSISELKVKYKASVHVNGTSNRQLNDEKQDESLTYELSTRFNYIHFYRSYSNKDKVEDSSDISEQERWFYMKKKVLYKVYRNKTKGSETKTFSTVEKYSDAIKEFSTIFDSMMPQAYEVAKGSEFLNGDTFTRYLPEDYEQKISYAATFYSSGAGNLRIVGAAKLDDSEDNNNTKKGVGTLTCKWNKYLLRNAALALTINQTDGTNKNDMKLTLAVSAKVSSLIIPTYPRLSNYSKNKLSSPFLI